MMVTLTVALTKEVLIFSLCLSTQLKTGIYYGSQKRTNDFGLPTSARTKFHTSTVLQLPETSVYYKTKIPLKIIAKGKILLLSMLLKKYTI